VSVNNFLWWGFGTVTVSDPGAALPSSTGYVFFGPQPSNNVNGTGFSFENFQFKTFNVGLNIVDNS
jgi:hypothetical protein